MNCNPRVTSKPITTKEYLNDIDLSVFVIWTGDVELEITTHCTGSCPESNPTSCPKDLVSEPVVDIEGVPKSFKKHLTPQEWADLKLTLNPPAGVPINLSRNVSDYVIEFLEKYPDLEKLLLLTIAHALRMLTISQEQLLHVESEWRTSLPSTKRKTQDLNFIKNQN